MINVKYTAVKILFNKFLDKRKSLGFALNFANLMKTRYLSIVLNDLTLADFLEKANEDKKEENIHFLAL